MSRWGNSKELTQASYGLIKENPGMNRWTVRAAVHGAVVGGLGALLGLALVLVGGLLTDSNGVLGAVVILVGAVTLVMAAVVSVTDDVLHGRELDEQAAKAAARPKLGVLAAWSGISVAVGALVSMVQGDGNGGVVTTLVRSLLAGLVASVWAVVTALVMSVIVLEHKGAVEAVRRSAGIIRSTWGESMMGSVRIGARFALRYTLPGFALLIGGVVLALAVGGAVIGLGAVMAVVGVALIVLGAVKAATCRTVFGVALYRWATGDGALGPFSEADLRGAVSVKDGPVPAPA